jgi:hypothetical protein
MRLYMIGAAYFALGSNQRLNASCCQGVESEKEGRNR